MGTLEHGNLGTLDRFSHKFQNLFRNADPLEEKKILTEKNINPKLKVCFTVLKL